MELRNQMDIHGKMEIVLLEYMERIVFGEYPTQTLPMLPLTGIRYYTLKYSITMKNYYLPYYQLVY